MRVAGWADVDAVEAVIAARETADIGEVDYTYVRTEWSRPEFDFTRDARVVEIDGQLAGYGVIDHYGAAAFVHPAHEGRGIGTALLGFCEARERELGRPVHRQRVTGGNAGGVRLLTAAGYRRARTYSRMSRPLPGPPAVDPPPGVAIRVLDRERDGAAAHAIDDVAFRPLPDYTPEDLEAFVLGHLSIDDFDTEASLAAERDGQVVGILLARRLPDQRTGYVNILAVDPSEQGNGIGTTLLERAFGVWTDRGLQLAELAVSSDNGGARRLYERLGMTARFTVDSYERPTAKSS
jgi:mycothiol synthase